GARRRRRPTCVHAVVRPRAGGGARARRRRCRARDVAFPLRRAAAERRLPPQRALLPALVARLPALAPAPAAEGGGAPRGDALAGAHARRCLARAVACAA